MVFGMTHGGQRMDPAAEMTDQRAGASMDDVLRWRKRTVVPSVRTMTCQ